ncbi:MAG: cell division protein FtsZ [Oligoflexales bacterium]
MSFNPEDIIPPGANIKVIGIGGGGGNAINTMIRTGIEGVEFIAANTDVQALQFSLAPTKIQVGKELTRGLGAGADPDIGRDAALEDRHAIQAALEGSNMVFITAGMGGGTGTGGAAIIAQIARDLGALAVGVVTIPFSFEGKRRRRHAEIGITRLQEQVDTLITIPNQRLMQVADPSLSMINAFKMADNVLVNAVRGISDIINIPGTINVDFADVKTVMASMGRALMGIGIAEGPNRAVEAARQAISSPLLEDIDIEGATGILINITAGEDISLMEVNEACSIVQEAAHEDANIIFGAVIDESMGAQIRVTVIATGFPFEESPDIKPSVLNEPFGFRRSSNNIYIPKRSVSPTTAKEEARPDPIASKAEELKMAEAQRKVNPPKPVTMSTLTTDGLTRPIEKEPFRPVVPVPEKPVVEQEKFEPLLNIQKPTAPEPKPIVAAQPVVQQSPIPTLEPEQNEVGAFVDDLMSQTEIDASAVKIEGASLAREAQETSAQFGFDDDDFFNIEPTGETLPLESLIEASNSKEEPLAFEDEPLLAGASATDQNQVMDEALELAERVKSQKTEQASDEDLEIPTFLRNGLKDLSLK